MDIELYITQLHYVDVNWKKLTTMDESRLILFFNRSTCEDLEKFSLLRISSSFCSTADQNGKVNMEIYAASGIRKYK